MMKSLKFTVLMLLSGAILLAAGLTIEARNPLAIQRANEVVALDWKALQGVVKNITPENARVVSSKGKVLLSQPVDNDGDGAVDQLLFVADFGADDEKKFEIKADSLLEIPDVEARAYARYVPERKDDFAWENDVIAFRAYGPALIKSTENCGFDCFMKRVKYPILDKWYKRAFKIPSYHKDIGEGHDGYKVGSSLGCGGSAVWYKGKMYRSNVYSSWKKFANGPIRAVFELTYGPWEVDGRQITEKKLISIDLGSRMFKVNDSFFANGKPAKLDVVVGLTTHGGDADAYENQKDGWIYCWDKIDKHYLGTGILVSPM